MAIFLGKQDVLNLMDINKNPFPTNPPKFIRMQLYHYHFTGSTNKIVAKNELDWWSRNLVEEYLPAISLEQEADIVKILNQMGVVTSPKKSKAKDSVLKYCLDYIRKIVLKVEPHILVWSGSFPVLPILFSI